MTEEQYIKTFAHQIYTRFKNLGIPGPKAQNAAITCILAMIDQYVKLAKKYNISGSDYTKAKQNFDALIKGLNAGLPGRKYVEVSINDIAQAKGCKPDEILINGYYTNKESVVVSIEEIAALKGCNKDQILIIY